MADEWRPCCTPGCKNLVKKPARKCITCRRRTGRAARARTNGRSFGWGAARVLGRSVLAASGPVSVNADALRDRVPRKPDGKCPFCGLEPCVCATPDEIRRARLFMEEARDD